MQPGQLDQRVTFQRFTSSDDGVGGTTETWASYCSRWAIVRPLTGRERDLAGQTESPRNYQVTVRRDPATAALTTKDRVTWAGKTMNIRFILDAGTRQHYLQMDCEEGVAA